jgi:hypothetical protein
LDVEKQSILTSWEDRKKTLVNPSGGGRGYVDPDIVPLCDALNRLDGVCTLQSCSGHSADQADGILYSGLIWLRLGSEMGRRFDATAHQLASHPVIERVGKIYWEDGKETITIAFRGNEAGLLAVSAKVILTYFETLAR